jgi:hypothetical protein
MANLTSMFDGPTRTHYFTELVSCSPWQPVTTTTTMTLCSTKPATASPRLRMRLPTNTALYI